MRLLPSCRLLAAVVVIGLGGGLTLADEPVSGSWRAKFPRQSREFELSLRARVEGEKLSSTIHPELKRTTGLDRDRVSSWRFAVDFSIDRDAGTFRCRGRGRWWRASGTFEFVPDASFADRLAEAGYGRPEPLELLQLALHDVSSRFVIELAEAGYREMDVRSLLRLRSHDIDIDYVSAMSQLGYLPEPAELIRLHNHGIGEATVRAFVKHGLRDVPVEDLVRLNSHGVDAEYVAGMVAAGFASEDVDSIIRMNAHGLTTDAVKHMRAVPGLDLDTNDLIRLNNHGIRPEYLARVTRALPQVVVGDVIRMNQHGLDSRGVADWSRLGYDEVEGLIRLRQHGVAPAAADGWRQLGYALTVEQLVRLNNMGVTPSFAAELAEQGYTDLDVEQLIRIRNRGSAEGIARKTI